MAKLPNGDKAVVPIDKLSEYALNATHPVGKHKARVFKSALGLTQDDSEFLRSTIEEIAETHEAEHEEPTPYGERYVIDFELTTDDGKATIRTAWMIRNNEDFPRLTTCYVIEDKSQ